MFGRIGKIAICSAMNIVHTQEKVPCTVIDDFVTAKSNYELNKKMISNIIRFIRNRDLRVDKFVKEDKKEYKLW